jgi:hypothetical protein
MKFAVAFIICFFTLSNYGLANVFEVDAQKVQSLSVSNPDGNINIGVTSNASASLLLKPAELPEHCQLKSELDGNQWIVELKATKKSGFWSWFSSSSSCQVDFEIKAPEKLAMEIKTGSGNVRVAAVHGPIELKVGSGNVWADANITQLDAKVGSGNMEINGLSGKAQVKIGSGNLKMRCPNPIDMGELAINVGSGNARIFFPEGTRVNADVKLGAGSVTSELSQDPTSQLKLKARAGSGNIHILKL